VRAVGPVHDFHRSSGSLLAKGLNPGTFLPTWPPVETYQREAAMSLDPTDRIEIVPAEGSWSVAKRLIEEVWPPEIVAQLPWKDVVWARPERRVLAFDRIGKLIGHAELFLREAHWQSRPVRIAGIGAVATRRDQQRRGVASAVMRSAIEEARQAFLADFSLLFCEARHAVLYEKLGWHRFEGDVFVEQPQGRIRFAVTDHYVFDLKLAPREGVIDLCGLPW
jgi:aminoglycoside 2'-N-acetyltransferase I